MRGLKCVHSGLYPARLECVPDVVPHSLIRHLSTQLLLQCSQPHQDLLMDRRDNTQSTVKYNDRYIQWWIVMLVQEYRGTFSIQISELILNMQRHDCTGILIHWLGYHHQQCFYFEIISV